MFPSPERIKTEVFTEVPQPLRRTDVPAERIKSGRGIPPSGSSIEGPSFDRKGNLYFVDNTYGRIFCASPKGDVRIVVEFEGEPNGLRVHKDGSLYVADYKLGIIRIDPDSGSITHVVSRYLTEHFRGPNDLVFAPTGNLYFTDQGQTDLADPAGAIYCLSADGKLSRIINNAPSPNGLLVSADERTVYVAVTRGNAIWRIPLTPEAQISRMGLFLQLSGGIGPDGMAMTEDGGIAVAHAGMGCVWIFSPKGEPLYRVESCRGEKTTNIAFGGPDRKTLFITETDTGSILSARVPVAGSLLYSHM
jgi:gluconolactonase